MRNIKIIGAGSIGNHLAHACRQMNWNVNMFDSDNKALKRTKENIYPSRYGKWDNQIKLFNTKNEKSKTGEITKQYINDNKKILDDMKKETRNKEYE